MVRHRLALGLLLPGVLAATNVAVHPMHTTFTEIVQPAVGREVTMTIRGFEDDLTAAARAATPGGTADSAITIYLRQRALLTDRSGRDVPFNAIGLRRRGGVIWVTLQSGRPVNLEGSRFINRALTEVFADQVNLVQVKALRTSRTIMFTSGDGSKAISG